MPENLGTNDFIVMMAELPSEEDKQQLTELANPVLVAAYRHAVRWGVDPILSSSAGDRYTRWQGAIEVELLWRMALVPPKQDVEVELSLGQYRTEDLPIGLRGEDVGEAA